ncbi:MAG: hypothetical protein HJJLKODD_01037 [Phycisphaerae bacterium]|nr:hypothetical protein [Phycisphaerae bacterium]
MLLLSYMLAALVTPGLWYAGLAAVSVPVIIHLLARRRYRRVRWAAMDFLLLADKQNRRKVTLRELILLLLRCLAMLLLGLLLARPHVAGGMLANLLPGENAGQAILLLDDSFSTSYRDNDDSTFQKARTELLSLLQEWQRRQAPQRVTILLASSFQSPLVQGVHLTPQSLAEITARLETTAPTEGRWPVMQTLQQLRDQLLAGDPASTALYLFSDFQRQDWGLKSDLTNASDETSATVNPWSVFEQWPFNERPLKVTLVQPVDGARDNLAITELKAAQSVWVAGVEGRLQITLKNYGSIPTAEQELNITVEELARPPLTVPRLAPGEELTLTSRLILPNAGSTRLRVELPADQLPLDNIRYFSAAAQEALRVLLVNGSPATERIDDETALLQIALQPEGPVYSGINATTLEEANLETVDPQHYQVVVLANVARPSEELLSRLEPWVRQGGGLAIFLGDEVDIDYYNERLFNAGDGLLPGRIGQLITATTAQQPPTLELLQPDHPVVRVFSSGENPERQLLGFSSYLEFIPTESTTSAPTTSTAPASSPPAVAILARYQDGRQLPALLEQHYGHGRVLLWSSSADLAWNNWARLPSYLVSMQEMVQYLAPAAASGDHRLYAGGDFNYPYDPLRYQPTAQLQPPNFPADPALLLTATSATPDQPAAWSQVSMTLCGFYQLLLEPFNTPTQSEWLAVNPDPRESDLACGTAEELTHPVGNLQIHWARRIADLGEGAPIIEQEMWRGVWVGLLLVLLSELSLAWWWGKG